MAIIIGRQGGSKKQNNSMSSTTGLGTSVAAGGSAHTKTTTPVQLIASTDACSYGIIVGIADVASTGGTQVKYLFDIMIGGAGSEQVLIPNLNGGQAGLWISASSSPLYYYFPIFIGSGVRISARAQSDIGSTTGSISVHLIQYPVPGRWYGSRVTDYGANTGTSSGTSHTPNGSGTTYATTTQLTASSTNPIRALQVGIDPLTDGTCANARGILRIAAGSSTNYIVSDLPFRENSSLDQDDANQANFMLSQMQFEIPASSYLGVGAMMSTAEARSFILYGVD